ncbi:hypothetical protein PVK06_005589 [Gossypium arboreum]|uniref:Uncharacterized protein n=1 Tax=Gossypium arboreum TaxID=29729 RepID=A0ABR0QV03_GOSAR|nr:hypothetical protein PVK06_005589 [Gossypium arboreum]
MPTFLVFPNELLLEPNDDDKVGEEDTTEMKTIEKKGEEEKIESVHIESNKDNIDVTQTATPTDTSTISKSTAPMTEQECVVH